MKKEIEDDSKITVKKFLVKKIEVKLEDLINVMDLIGGVSMLISILGEM